MAGNAKDPQAPNFRKALNFRRFQDVVQQIQEAILDGRIANGDMLPSERELKERFSISRGTLREALRVLEDRGLIEIKIGNRGGTFVRKVTTEHASESLAILIRSQEVSLEHLAQFRQSVEGDIAALAAQKANQEDLAALEGIATAADRLLQEPGSEHRDFYAQDQSFHVELGRITTNPVYLLVMKSIHANILKYYETFLEMSLEDKQENVHFFFDLIEAFRLGQVNEARILAQNHVMQFGRKMRSMRRRAEGSPDSGESSQTATISETKEETRNDESKSKSPYRRQ
jgi:DNA-binding FadR family transcriptional regulator